MDQLDLMEMFALKILQQENLSSQSQETGHYRKSGTYDNCMGISDRQNHTKIGHEIFNLYKNVNWSG